jgi:hypothetical protein
MRTPDIDDVRGIALASVHAVTNAAMILGVPVLLARRLVTRPGAPAGSPNGPSALALTDQRSRTNPVIGVAAALIAVGLTVTTRRAAWGLVRLWLRMDEPARAEGAVLRQRRA